MFWDVKWNFWRLERCSISVLLFITCCLLSVSVCLWVFRVKWLCFVLYFLLSLFISFSCLDKHKSFHSKCFWHVSTLFGVVVPLGKVTRLLLSPVGALFCFCYYCWTQNENKIVTTWQLNVKFLPTTFIYMRFKQDNVFSLTSRGHSETLVYAAEQRSVQEGFAIPPILSRIINRLATISLLRITNELICQCRCWLSYKLLKPVFYCERSFVWSA